MGHCVKTEVTNVGLFGEDKTAKKDGSVSHNVG